MLKWLRRWAESPAGLRGLVNLYGPYLGAGVRVKYLSEDFRELHVSMRLTWYNRNYVGTHFGGSLYAMVDPFYMLMLIQVLGSGYIVWDKAAEIDFIKPGKGTVHAHFHLTDEMLEEVLRQTADGQKYLPAWDVDVVDESGDTVARIRKTLYIRRKA